MNAIDMMVQTLTKQLAERAPDMIGKALANLPPDVLHAIGQIRDTTLSFKAQLDRIENQNRLIMDHLKITDAVQNTENDDGTERLLPQ